MAKPKAVTDPTLLAAALEGLLLQRQRLDDQIASVRSMLGTSGGGRSAPASSGGGKGSRPRRSLSAAARKRIAEAQKKRWAEYRKKTTKQA